VAPVNLTCFPQEKSRPAPKPLLGRPVVEGCLAWTRRRPDSYCCRNLVSSGFQNKMGTKSCRILTAAEIRFRGYEVLARREGRGRFSGRPVGLFPQDNSG